MTLWTYVRQSLRHYFRTGLAVVLGVAAATAVFAGALIVGESVRGSLRELALDRLGRIAEILVVDRFFRAELGSEIQAAGYEAVVPAITLPSATIERPDDTHPCRAANVLVLGVNDHFWQLSDPAVRPATGLEPGQIVINEELAKELGAKVGDELILRLAKSSQIPADSPLGRKTDRIGALAQLKVVAILPTRSLGRFSLQPTQTLPRVAYVALADLQSSLEQPGKVNTLLVAGQAGQPTPKEAASEALAKAMKPKLGDLGLQIKHVIRTFESEGKSETIFDYYQLTSDRMVLEPAAADATLAAWKKWQPNASLTYLANSIRKIGEEAGIPYSMITAIDVFPGGPISDKAGQPLTPLSEDAIALNSWAAEDLHAMPGDMIRLAYFEPETTHGEEQETHCDLKLQEIVPLTEPGKAFNRRKPAEFKDRPTIANDPHLTPEVPGITDQDSIDKWDAPFPFDNKRVRSRDDTYWENHRTTPKGFVSLATGRKLWQSRFGWATAIRVPATEGIDEQILAKRLLSQLEKSGERLGMEFRPIRRESEQASAGTTPFDVLFLALSMFLIAAALMLVWLLFRLGVELRASEIGTLLALGWSRGRITRALLGEGAILATLGGVLGLGIGVGYAWVMLYGLKTWWIGAISSPFLNLHLSETSPLGGLAIGILTSLATIWSSLRLLRKVSVRELMSGRTSNDVLEQFSPSRFGNLAVPLLFSAAFGLAILATRLGGEAQAGAFLAAGAALLTAILLVIRRVLVGQGTAITAQSGLTRLAIRNAGRNPTRSLLSMGLMGAASFLIVAVSSFRLAPTESGSGGFSLVAESSEPIMQDLNATEGRAKLLGDKAKELQGTEVLAFRVRPGDDASCRNLYRASQPRILGVSQALVTYYDQPREYAFVFAGSAAKTHQEQSNPWQLVSGEHSANEPLPVVLDKNTAMYSLQLYGGIGEEFTVQLGGNRPLRLRVAGLLANSVLQGNLLISDADFRRLFPQISGQRYFLIRPPVKNADQVASLLESQLGDEGFDVTHAQDVLRDLLAVQNTYISTFQSLGGLGLVLGMFGLAAVQLRSIAERRGELALLRAIGFAQTRLSKLVLLENLVLLVGGLATGTLAALAAVLPHMLLGGAQAPLGELAILLALVLAVGILAGLWAVRSAVRADLLPALRGS